MTAASGPTSFVRRSSSKSGTTSRGQDIGGSSLGVFERRKATLTGSEAPMGNALSEKGVTYDQEGNIVSCIFCDICAGKKRDTEIVYEDDKVVVFLPLKVCASTHLLTVPKQHIRNARCLRKEHLCILDYMREVGERVLAERSGADPSAFQFAFHIPPYNSVDHLHLHCHALPWTGPFSAVKYKTGTKWCMSFDSVRQLVEQNKELP